MSLNCNEIDLVLKELALTGSFIQDIVQPSFDSIALYTYKPGTPKTVFICLAAGECRINEVKRKIPKNEKPLRFNEMLRSKIKGARITECRQIEKDRIIKISLLRPGTVYVMPAANEKLAQKNKKSSIEEDKSADEELDLYIRLWSNAANIFLCNKEGTILDCFYRRPAKNEISGQHFSLPDNKINMPEQQFPIRTFDSLSPDASLSFNEKIDLFYSQNAAKTSLSGLLEQAEKWHNSHKSRLENALGHLEEKRKGFLNAGQWKHEGDLILSYSYMFQEGKISNGFLECTDYDTGKVVRIKIDPHKNSQENAELYYSTYKKQTSGLDELENDIASTKQEISELDKKYEAMLLEKNPVKLEQILRKSQKPKQQEKNTRPGLSYYINGWTIFAGRDASENDELLRRYVKGDDLWFHTRDYPGGYIFVKAKKGKTVPLEIIIAAGNLAVHFSKARKNGEADLYYTAVKHLRRAKNGPKGLVLPSNEKNLHIKTDTKVLRQLENSQTI